MPTVYSRKRLRLQENQKLHLDHAAPTSPESPPPAQSPKKRRKLVQLHIDAGQSNLAFTKCEQCNLVYTPGTADEKLHRSRHNATLRKNLPPFWWQPGLQVIHQDEERKFCAVRKGDAKKIVKQVTLLDEFVTEKLGGAEALRGFGCGLWIAIICMQGNDVKGYLYAERTENVRRASVGEDGVATVHGRPLKITCCGVKKLWVSVDSRRKGLASEMINLARRLLIYGYEIPPTRIAFTPPSTNGALLAKSYAACHKRDKIFVYKC